MKLRNRFLLVGFGVLVFVVAVPVLVLFTRGYKIDWQEHKFVKTGTLVVNSQPSRATISLNNKQISGTTPETIRFLLPGSYDIQVAKDGYQPWTKRLAINPQFATWANLDRDFITLFLQKAQNISSTDANFASLSQDGNEIAYVSKNQLYVYNVSNQNSQNLGDISNLNVPYTFSGNLSWNNAAAVVNFFRSNAKVPVIDVNKISKIFADGNYFVYLSNNTLFDAKQSVMLDKNVQGFTVDGENLWYVQNNNLIAYNLRTKTSTTISKTIPVSTNAKIIRGEGNTFLVLDNSLYVLNDDLEKIYDGVNFANYDSSAHELLYANSNEILTFTPTTKSTTLILRSISPVSAPVLNSFTGFVFFVNENKIKAIELDGRDHRNIYTLIDQVANDAQIAPTSDGSNLTVFGSTSIAGYKVR